MDEEKDLDGEVFDVPADEEVEEDEEKGEEADLG